MAFSDYKTISQVQKEFGVKYKKDNFIVAQSTDPSTSFVESLSSIWLNWWRHKKSTTTLCLCMKSLPMESFGSSSVIETAPQQNQSRKP